MRNASVCRDNSSEEFTWDEDQKDPQVATLEGQASGEAIKGAAASLGVAEGPAVVLSDSDNLAALYRIREGALLVCNTASRNLIAIMPRLRALATERGGVLAIAPGVARAHGIPAVVGAAGLTRMIKDGDIIRVDGTKGTVEIIGTRLTKSPYMQ
jgi:phosphoenolpyruvate synthase/pyruvate phosphate dikinase